MQHYENQLVKLVALVFWVTFVGSISGHQEASTASDGAVVNTILRLERVWERAVRNGDQATIDQIVAPDCVFISSTGRLRTKSQADVESRQRLAGLTSSTVMEINVRLLGDTAIVVGLTRDVSRENDLYSVAQHRWTHVMHKRKDVWRIVSIQVTPVQEAIERG